MGGEEHKFTVRECTGARQQMLSGDKNSPVVTICELVYVQKVWADVFLGDTK